MTARFLMCRPKHFGVTYTINPWMDPATWAQDARALAATSQREWEGLHQALSQLGASIELIPSRAGVPDLVFTANAAVVLDRIALLARFRHVERRGEEPLVADAIAALRTRGLIDAVRHFPEGVAQEGAGDCVWDDRRQLFWMGFGPRSDAAAQPVIEETFGVAAVPLQLADPRFYHLDTALCPLPGGEVMYVPRAFTPAGRAAIARRVAPSERIEITPEDACRLAANAVAVGDAVVLSGCGELLRAKLMRRGYRVIETPLTSFLRSGGSAFCLTLRLDRRCVASCSDVLAVAG